MRILSGNLGKKLVSTATRKTGLKASKTASKKVFHKILEATGELVENKTTEKIVKPKPVSDVTSRNVEEIIITQQKTQEIWNELRKVL